MFQRSMSPLPLPKNQNDVADAGPERRRLSHANIMRTVVEGRTESLRFMQSLRRREAARPHAKRDGSLTSSRDLEDQSATRTALVLPGGTAIGREVRVGSGTSMPTSN